jgi:hypothetical protein
MKIDLKKYAFLQNLAKNPENTVIGLVRSPASLEAKLKKDGITNVHVLQGDVNNRKSLKVCTLVYDPCLATSRY